MKRFVVLVLVMSVLACTLGFAQTSVAELQVRANDGEAEAQNSLGLRYLLGDGVQQNFDTAYVWFLQAANRGYAKGEYNLAVMYAAGLGVHRDNDQAVFWHCKAADQGLHPAQYNLTDKGYLFSSDTGGKTNDKQPDKSSDSGRKESKGIVRADSKDTCAARRITTP